MPDQTHDWYCKITEVSMSLNVMYSITTCRKVPDKHPVITQYYISKVKYDAIQKIIHTENFGEKK
jgi:hypothetical protein